MTLFFIGLLAAPAPAVSTAAAAPVDAELTVDAPAQGTAEGGTAAGEAATADGTGAAAPGAPAAGQATAPGAGNLKNSKAQALLFWMFALMTAGGALFVITRRNLVVAVIGMVGMFFAIAALYAMLFAHFMAVIQVLVYAGAIMVLFVFVIMILNRSEDEPWALHGLLGKGLAGVALAYLLFRLGQVLWTVRERVPAAIPSLGDRVDPGDWGSTHAMAEVLFKEYLFPFEAVSLVLLVAVVGAIAVARPNAPSEHLGKGPLAGGQGAGGQPPGGRSSSAAS
jgi:NADH-quinone oxidoreductase subunit J